MQSDFFVAWQVQDQRRIDADRQLQFHQPWLSVVADDHPSGSRAFPGDPFWLRNTDNAVPGSVDADATGFDCLDCLDDGQGLGACHDGQDVSTPSPAVDGLSVPGLRVDSQRWQAKSPGRSFGK
jgi:hypothetical protein